jgi:plastocyanin
MSTGGYMPNKNITINVLPSDSNQGNRGTFLGPPPHVKVDIGDTVTFNVTPTGSTFAVVFVGLSPFPVNDLTDSSPTAAVTYPGIYHYQVSVTLSSGETFRITNCPEIEA